MCSIPRLQSISIAIKSQINESNSTQGLPASLVSNSCSGDWGRRGENSLGARGAYLGEESIPGFEKLHDEKIKFGDDKEFRHM